jgi:predicted Zn-dependent protease
MRHLAVILALVLGAFSGAAQAAPDGAPSHDQTTLREQRLERLFASLAQAPDPQAAKPYEATIEALWLQSGSPTVDLLMTRVRALSGNNRDGAVALLGSIIDIDPAFAEAWNTRATLLLASGAVTRAMRDLHATLKREPRHFGAWAMLGRILEESGDSARALKAYDRALAINPQMTDVRQEADRLRVEVRGREL